MQAERFRIEGTEKLRLQDYPTGAEKAKVNREEIVTRYQENLQEMARLQDIFYADGREGVIFVVQAIDAAGKDSVIKHVCRGLNPQGLFVHSFKAPTSEELSHDYLWRVNQVLPRRGEIAIFNRSYYEDIVAAQVRDLQKTYHMAGRVTGEEKKEFYSRRCRQVRDYERYLYENSYRVVKVFLHVSKKTQKKRFLERLDRPEKNWKFSASDLADRALFDQYMAVYEQTIRDTASHRSPWYILPADQKWYTRYLFSEIIVDTLRQCDSAYPAPAATPDQIREYKRQLLTEKS